MKFTELFEITKMSKKEMVTYNKELASINSDIKNHKNYVETNHVNNTKYFIFKDSKTAKYFYEQLKDYGLNTLKLSDKSLIASI